MPKVSPPNSGKPWTPAEIQQLLADFEAGWDLPELAKKCGRSVYSVVTRLEKHDKLMSRDGRLFELHLTEFCTTAELKTMNDNMGWEKADGHQK